MQLLEKPTSHIKLVREVTETCLRACQGRLGKFAGDTANLRLIEANRPYMDEESHARADETIAKIKAGEIRYKGILFKSIQES
jgi:hypothetical protein